MNLKADIQYIVQAVGFDLNIIKGKSILITGGTGFIGHWLIETIAFINDSVERPCKIYVPTRNPKKFFQTAPHLAKRSDIEIIESDIRSFKYPTHSCEYIIHAASPVDPKVVNDNLMEAVDIIIAGTRCILEQAIHLGTKRFLYISSGAVYGLQPSDLMHLSEDHLGGPDTTTHGSAYAEAKRLVEVMCSIFHQKHKLPIVIARPFTFVGPYQDINAGFAVTEFINNCLKKEPIIIKGDGTLLRSYCYAADLAVALWKILFNGKEGRAYNIGSESAISIYELAREIVSLTNAGSDIVVMGKPKPNQRIMRYIPDITRIKTELGFAPSFELNESLRKTIEWFKSVNQM